MKLDEITHQRNVCHDIIIATLEKKLTLNDVDMVIVRRAQKSMTPVSPGVLEILERMALRAFVESNR